MSNIYKPADLCIYCGITENLSKEHILAYSLGGTTTLRSASCQHHRDLTSAFELKVSRGIYGKYRDINFIQSRRKIHDRDQRLSTGYKMVGENWDGTKQEFYAPLRETPVPNMWLTFTQPPTILTDCALKSPLGISYLSESDGSHELKYNKLFLKTGFKTISVENTGMQIMSPEYFQMLAKTAHAFLWAEKRGLGYSPLLLGIIDGDISDVTDLIGCDERLPRSDKQLELHEVYSSGVTFLVVHITINAFPSTPRYLVVAGRC